jgi:hypothetical protein
MTAQYSTRLVPGVVTSPYPCPLIEEEGIAPVKVNRLKSVE